MLAPAADIGLVENTPTHVSPLLGKKLDLAGVAVQ
jgi:hypothetical protein